MTVLDCSPQLGVFGVVEGLGRAIDVGESTPSGAAVLGSGIVSTLCVLIIRGKSAHNGGL